MKSLLITFLMFIVIFILLKIDIFSIFTNTYFHILCYTSFILVFACGIFFVGLPLKSHKNKEITTPTTDDKGASNEK